MSKSKKAKTSVDATASDDTVVIIDENVEWNRTGDKDTDQFHLYESGLMYDCTIRVCANSQEADIFQDFKCHKIMLGSASSVLQKMLFGSIKEATYGRDEPIPLKDVQPKVFDLAMKYVYGGRDQFGDMPTAIELHKFADMMDIKKLKKEVENYMVVFINAKNVFAVFDFWLSKDLKDKLFKCYSVISSKTSEAFDSECWLAVSEATVKEVLGSSKIHNNANVLLQALLKWGRAKFPDLNNEQMRTKLDPYLKMIKFCTMPAEHFADLCDDLPILTTEEKYNILLCIVKGSTTNMPEGFSKIISGRRYC